MKSETIASIIYLNWIFLQTEKRASLARALYSSNSSFFLSYEKYGGGKHVIGSLHEFEFVRGITLCGDGLSKLLLVFVSMT